MIKRPATITTVIALICLPAAMAAVEAVRYFAVNRPTHTIDSSGLTREYTLHVPASYDRSKPTPLVISMHGAGLWGAAQQDVSQWNRVADREGVIVAYPSARSGVGPRVWDAEDGRGVRVDVQFISDLIDALRKTYHIDTSRIYADGLSNGGGMAFVLSCTMPERIAAVGLVASAQTEPWEWCEDDRPVPMIAFHGTEDTATPYLGGRTWITPPRGRGFPSIPGWTANWARRNRCGSTATETPVAPDVTRIAYPECDAAPVVLYRIEGGGHTWPGGGHLPEWFVGTTTPNIDASSVMWEFFKAHPLRK
jgi:polyhydroxybutyrate depolymerase